MKYFGPILLLVPSLSSSTAYTDCLGDAAAYHRVDSALLCSITPYESRMNPLAVNRNHDGSWDLDPMQTNSAHLPWLTHYGVTQQQLLDACINAYVDAWVLHANIDRFGATWRTVGAYNATTPAKQSRYANRIYVRQQSLQHAALP